MIPMWENLVPPLGWIKPALAIGALVASFSLGYSVSNAFAQRARLEETIHEQQDALDRTSEAIQAQNAALARAREYEAKRDALVPQIRTIQLQGQTIVREIEKCPLPTSASRLLDEAADVADR